MHAHVHALHYNRTAAAAPCAASSYLPGWVVGWVVGWLGPQVYLVLAIVLLPATLATRAQRNY